MRRQRGVRVETGWLRMVPATLLSGLALCLIAPWQWSLPLRTRWTVQAQKPFILSAYADEAQSQVRLRGGPEPESADLPLVRGEFEGLRFKWGSQGQRIVVHRLQVRGLFWERNFSGRELSRFFSCQGELGMRPGQGESIVLEVRGETPLLLADAQFVKRIRAVAWQRALLAGLLWLVLLVVFRLPGSCSWADGWGRLRPGRQAPVLMALLLLLTLAGALWIPWPLRPVDERRVLAAPPRFRLDEWSDWGRQIETYLADHQGFRPLLVRLFNRLCIDALQSAPAENVLLGRRDWLFMGKERADLDARRAYRGLDPFTENELQAWTEMILQRRRWLAERGVQYRFVVAPGKASVYPEYLPAGYARCRGPKRLDQLRDRLAGMDKSILVDLRLPLQMAKIRPWPVYHRSDSHWSAFGAFTAADHLLAGLSQTRSHIIPSGYRIEAGPRFGGDLAIALGLEMDRFREPAWVRMSSDRAAAVWRKLPDLGPYVRRQTAENPNVNSGRLLLVHDSFAHELAPFLADRCASVYLIWDWGLGFYPQQIVEFKPDWVVDEMAERYLYGPLPINPPELSGQKP